MSVMAGIGAQCHDASIGPWMAEGERCEEWSELVRAVATQREWFGGPMELGGIGVPWKGFAADDASGRLFGSIVVTRRAEPKLHGAARS